jgi:hypothetical protein
MRNNSMGHMTQQQHVWMVEGQQAAAQRDQAHLGACREQHVKSVNKQAAEVSAAATAVHVAGLRQQAAAQRDGVLLGACRAEQQQRHQQHV